MQYRGIRYTLRLGIVREQWLVGIHPDGGDVIEKKMQGSRRKAEQRAFAMIDTLRRQETALLVKA